MSLALNRRQAGPVWRRLRLGAACLIVALLVLAALVGPAIAPFEPDAVDIVHRLQPPGEGHLLGTDHLGRDIFSRLIAGTRTSLGCVAATLVLILIMGLGLGGLSGYAGGRIDQAIMRVADIFMTFPTLILALFMIGMLGTGLVNVIIAIALSHWAWYARIARGIVMSMRHRDFLLAARLAGASRARIFVEHLLPATFSQMIVLATLDVGHMMLHVSGLSFLGLGVQAPTAEWGVMIADARQFVWTAPMLIFWPGLALFLTVMAFNMLGDALRDRLDPGLVGEAAH
ncbi:nickel ABC transporter permease subunit NikC [Rhodovulum sulfidophilum]|uniref:nickel ABC transporter permease subunit NikC n=1 Tax=Rhodovulum sulfidophilum TaxID=35806 RepID=UPI001389CCA1|nr:nickel ABC transporter permease subunit NikC [Rhodovulum sulfidophilum]NDK34553.1 nickel ABC transporter permease subunit NikC [Rhodovulum sulfidophilum]